MMEGDRKKFSANSQLPLTTSVVLKYGEDECMFGISVRCPVYRFYEVVQDGLGMKIDKILYYQDKMRTKFIEIDDKKKWLLEEYKIEDGHTIEVFGNKTSQSKNGIDGIIVILQWVHGDKNASIKMETKITEHTTVNHYLKQIRLDIRDVLPDTIELTYKDQKLNSNLNASLMKDLGVENGDVIKMTGTYFPLSLLGKNALFAQTMGIHINTECVVCYEKITGGAPYDCGHLNVCTECAKKRANCPICK